MPELPEVETTLNGIRPHLQNAMIENVIVRNNKLRWDVSSELSMLKNCNILDLQRRAKYIIIKTEQGFIIGHLGMSGTLRVVPYNSPIAKHDHIDIVLNNGKLLRYNDPRRFGAWLWTDNIKNFHLFLKLGIEPLSEQFNTDYLWKKSRKRLTAVKTFLMDNTIVVGVGNIYASETLFLSGIHPQKIAGTLSKKQCEILVQTIKQVLEKAIKQGGTTLKDFLQPDGRPGYFTQQLLVYGNKNQPCTKCGTKIESLIINQRNSFFCPKCQKK
ncbi:bifunctional DNA-formamidopyrimidine glycosylase/DNA-(apurinic or apyrimidinic site) lyase [Seminibacterium arietis]|uniref:Formamidopyrimidine-DNA glycosylase n=1 Tax=Seminibacterium arietis TaxID=1173502 RepID=A0ABW3IA73_9PAST